MYVCMYACMHDPVSKLRLRLRLLGCCCVAKLYEKKKVYSTKFVQRNIGITLTMHVPKTWLISFALFSTIRRFTLFYPTHGTWNKYVSQLIKIKSYIKDADQRVFLLNKRTHTRTHTYTHTRTHTHTYAHSLLSCVISGEVGEKQCYQRAANATADLQTNQYHKYLSL